MVDLKKALQGALAELRKGKERKFKQTVDLIINLQKFDLKKNQINLFVDLPFKVKDKKICAFFEVRDKNIDTVTATEFKKYSDQGELKKLVNKYDFFIAQASLMPKVATTFGRVLGPVGKMPSPQLGILANPNEKSVAELTKKIDTSVKIRSHESSLKIAVGKEDMKDEEIVENAMAIYNAIFKHLPREKENVKNIMLKFTMTKPQKIYLDK